MEILKSLTVTIQSDAPADVRQKACDSLIHLWDNKHFVEMYEKEYIHNSLNSDREKMSEFFDGRMQSILDEIRNVDDFIPNQIEHQSKMNELIDLFKNSLNQFEIYNTTILNNLNFSTHQTFDKNEILQVHDKYDEILETNENRKRVDMREILSAIQDIKNNLITTGTSQSTTEYSKILKRPPNPQSIPFPPFSSSPNTVNTLNTNTNVSTNTNTNTNANANTYDDCPWLMGAHW